MQARFQMDQFKIVLSNDLLIAAGSERMCYKHPYSDHLCLKVPRQPGAGKRCPQCRVDLYTAKRLRVRKVPMKHFADCIGWVDTSEGPAILVQRILNDNGSPSLTLKESLKSGVISWKKLDEMLDELKIWALKYGVVISELNVSNLMHRIDAAGDHLVVIDGLGGRKPDLIFYLRSHVSQLARQKTAKRWGREYNKVKTAAFCIIEKKRNAFGEQV